MRRAQPVNRLPFFEWEDTRLAARVNRRVVHAGHALAGERLDDRGREAIDALFAVLDEPGRSLPFRLSAGQAVWMHNRPLAHHRTRFPDAADPALRRHLARIYLRDHGPRRYLGDEGEAAPWA